MFTLFKTLSYNLTLISSLFADGIQAYQIFVETKLSLISELGNVHSFIATKKGKQINTLDLDSLNK